MTQEIGIVETAEGSLDVSLFPIGKLLKMIPYHVSVAAGLNLYSTPCTQISFLQERIKGTEKASPIHTLFHR